jgi:hypothetical protein
MNVLTSGRVTGNVAERVWRESGAWHHAENSVCHLFLLLDYGREVEGDGIMAMVKALK